MRPIVTVAPPTATPGSIVLRDAPAGLPDADLQPPVTAAAGDPFTTARVLRLVACLERGRPTRIDDIAAALNARHLDWAFSGPVVADVLVQLQSNWMADYRNGSGIVVEDGPYGSTLDDRGLDPGRPLDRPAGRARGCRLSGRPGRLQPSSTGAASMTDQLHATRIGAPGRCMCRGRARS